MSELDAATLSSVANTNLKVKSEAGVDAYNLAIMDSVDHRRRSNLLAEAALASNLKRMSEVDPVEALSQVKQFTGHDSANNLSSLGAAVSAIQQLVKGAQTTPPVSHP